MSAPAKSSRQSTRSGRTPPEATLVLPRHAELRGLAEGEQVELVDTHTHVLSTFHAYQEKYPEGQHVESIQSFVKATLPHMHSVVDVWCEAPMRVNWKEVVGQLSELKKEDPNGLNYYFVVGAHPNAATGYSDELEASYLEAYSHPLCVGWGEIGLDYHYDSPKEAQHEVLRRQLRIAVKAGLNKAITIHTREADSDILEILTSELPKEQKLHIHCFTDSPVLAHSLLEHFPNCFIGITGVVSFSSNLNTAQVIRDLGAKCSPESPEGLRIVMETDAPYMVPTTLPAKELGMTSKQRFPFSTASVLPWSAEYVAKVLNENKGEEERKWTTVDVLRQARENARKVYGI
ncbi:hypothetical protein JCM8547_007858 [Rhodosporidiobolus lusitaniae]